MEPLAHRTHSVGCWDVRWFNIRGDKSPQDEKAFSAALGDSFAVVVQWEIGGTTQLLFFLISGMSRHVKVNLEARTARRSLAGAAGEVT